MPTIENKGSNLFENRELPGQNILVHSDLALRHTMAADLLNISLDDTRARTWYKETDRRLVTLLSDKFSQSVTLINAQKTRAVISDKVHKFRSTAEGKGFKPLVISVDPIYGDAALADYVFQESRVSLTHPDKPVIDLEHNKRGYANRFGRKGPENNGAGKPWWYQLEEVNELVSNNDGKKVDIAFVDDYINSGISLVTRFASLLNKPDIQATFMPGVISRKTHDAFLLQDFAVDPVWTLEKPARKYIDLTDLLPTLGGRSIGWNREQEDGTFTQPVIRTVGGFNRMIPLGVDAVVGNYPWQVDLYTSDAEPNFMKNLQQFSLATALEFWTSLEEARGTDIAWEDLHALNGQVKVFYPVKDFGQSNIPLKRIGHGPREVIESLITNTQ